MDLYMTEQGDLEKETITQAEIDAYKAKIKKDFDSNPILKPSPKPEKISISNLEGYKEGLEPNSAKRIAAKEGNSFVVNLSPEDLLIQLIKLYDTESQNAQKNYANSQELLKNRVYYENENEFVKNTNLAAQKALEENLIKLKREREIAKIAYSQAQAELKYIQKYPNTKEFIQQLEKDIVASKTKIAALEKDKSSSVVIDSKESTLSPKNLELYNQYKLLIKAKTFYDDTIEFERITNKSTLNINSASSKLHSKELNNIENEVKTFLEHGVEENKKIFIGNKKSDQAAIVYYNSLNKLEDFYKYENERHKNNPDKLKEYDLQAKILQNRADEFITTKKIKSALDAEKENLKTAPSTERLIQEQQENKHRAIAQEIEGRSILARASANKLNRSQTKEEKTKEANAKVHSFLGDIINQQADFVDSLSKDTNLGSNQKQGKFLAEFLKKSVEIYVTNHNSETRPQLKDQLQTLLVNNGDKDIIKVISKINNNLDDYIKQMDHNIGKELDTLSSKAGLGDFVRNNELKKIIDNSLYVITAKKINEVVEQTTKLTPEEKQNFSSSSIMKKLYSVLNYISGNKNSQQYLEIKLKENLPTINESPSSMSSLLYSPIKNWKMSSKVQGITNSLKNLGISEVSGISDLHKPDSTPSRRMSMETTRRSSDDFTDARSSIRSSINSVDFTDARSSISSTNSENFYDTRTSGRNSRGG